MNRRLAWAVLAFVLLVSLVIAARPESGAATPGERANRLARSLRCPTCSGLSAAESDAKAAVAVRAAIRRGIAEGQTDREIRAFLLSRYPDLSLTPGNTGIDALVWGLPVAAAVVGLAGLAAAFRRWRRPVGAATDADRALVAEARAP